MPQVFARVWPLVLLRIWASAWLLPYELVLGHPL